MNASLRRKFKSTLTRSCTQGSRRCSTTLSWPIEEHAEQGVRPTLDCRGDCQEETVEARPARLVTTIVTDWKQEQKEDPVLYQVAQHLRAPRKTCKAALHKVLDRKATAAYVKAKEQLLIKNGLLYHKTQQGQANEIMFQFVVPQRHWGAALDGCHQEVARHDSRPQKLH